MLMKTATRAKSDSSQRLDSLALTWMRDGLIVCALRMVTERMDFPSSESNRARTGDLRDRGRSSRIRGGMDRPLEPEATAGGSGQEGDAPCMIT